MDFLPCGGPCVPTCSDVKGEEWVPVLRAASARRALSTTRKQSPASRKKSVAALCLTRASTFQ